MDSALLHFIQVDYRYHEKEIFWQKEVRFWYSSPFAFCFNRIATLKMETTPEFLLLLPVALFLAHAEFTTAKSKIVEGGVHQKMCKQRFLTAQSNSFLLSLLILANLNSIPQSTIPCNETWAVTFHIDLCELSSSQDWFVLFFTTALSVSVVSLVFMSSYFCIALFYFIFSQLLTVIRTDVLFSFCLWKDLFKCFLHA